MSEQPGQQNAGDGSQRSSVVTRWNDRVYRLVQEKNIAAKYGIVMIWHRWIDANLTRAIETKFAADTKTAAGYLFKYPGGLSSFSARVHLGRCIGLYGSITYADLKRINDIRNDFAHPRDDASGELEILGFDNEAIAEACGKLKFLEHSAAALHQPKPTTPEEQYEKTASAIALSLWVAHIMPRELQADPAVGEHHRMEFLP